MKRGASPDRNQPNPEIFFDGHEYIADDVLFNIFNLLGLQQFVGQKNIALVNKKWNNVITHSDDFKYTYRDIYNTCLQEPDFVLELLNDDSIVKQLTWQQFIAICSCNPDIAKYILFDDTLNPNLNEKDTLVLCKNSLPIVQHIMTSKPDAMNDLFTILHSFIGPYYKIIESGACDIQDGFDFADLNTYLPIDLLNLLDMPELCELLEAIPFEDLNSDDVNDQLTVLNIAREILDLDLIAATIAPYGEVILNIYQSICSDIKETLDNMIQNFGNIHNHIDESYLNLAKALFGYGILTLGQHHLSIARRIVNSPNLCAQLSGANLVSLGQHHESIAKFIITTPALFNKLTAEDEANLAQSHYKIAKLLGLTHKEQFDQMSASQLAVVQTVCQYAKLNNMIECEEEYEPHKHKKRRV